MVRILNRDEAEPFTSEDGSLVRELAHPRSSDVIHQSLAEATIEPGETQEHLHQRSEEIYSFVAGEGRMRLGSDEARVRAGDTVVIAPGTRHKLWNEGEAPLVLLCCCSPPHSPDDTLITE